MLLALVVTTTMEGCVSDSRDEGKNKPLPRMTKEQAEDWARRFSRHLADVIGVPLNSRKPLAEFFPCKGKRGETATDARYRLMYRAWVDLPPEKHNEAAKRLRTMFEKDGYNVGAFRLYRSYEESMIVEARPDKGGFYIAVESAGEGSRQLGLAIDSPCLIPPSETQKEQ